MTAFRLAHISDPHLPPPYARLRPGDVLSKRLLSRFAWRRKHTRHSKPVLDAITADIGIHPVDHLAITGDLTNFSTPEEFAAARVWLGSLGDPANITVSPGNHDALVTVEGRADFSSWRPWIGDPGSRDFPHVRVRGPIAIVNLSSAVPTRLHLAQGTLGARQIEYAEAALKNLGARGLYRVVLLHHPVSEGVVSLRKSLTDRTDLRAALRRVGAELVLHGHAHEARLTAIPGPSADIPVIGVPSASTPVGLPDAQAARWNKIDILREGHNFRTQVTAREITTDLRVVTAGRFVLT